MITTADLDRTFTATMQRSDAAGGWTFVVTDWTAEFFGIRGLVGVTGTIDDHPFEGSFMALGDDPAQVGGTSRPARRHRQGGGRHRHHAPHTSPLVTEPPRPRHRA